MFGLIDAPAGVVEGFKYSEAMLQSGLVWDAETLATFLVKPKDVVPGTKMIFNGLKKQKDIENLLAFLKEQDEQ